MHVTAAPPTTTTTAIPPIDFFAFDKQWRAISPASEVNRPRALHLLDAIQAHMRLPPGGVNQDGVIEFRQLLCKG